MKLLSVSFNLEIRTINQMSNTYTGKLARNSSVATLL